MNTLVIILGPTASGKTALAVRLATYFNTDIINADARQFYKGLDIGTAKPTPEEQAGIKHHLLDFLNPSDHYNISCFEKDVLSLLERLFQSNTIVLMTGGSGLYIDTICHGIDPMPGVNPILRSELENEFKTNGIEPLRQKLLSLDPEYFASMDTMNPHRLIRAIEVCVTTGIKYSQLRRKNSANRFFRIVKIGLDLPRQDLYEKINHRTEEMVRSGLEDEARKFFHLKNFNALNTVGYKEFFEYFAGDLTLSQAIEKIRTNTRRYAKRQMTWFRKDKDIQWFSPEAFGDILTYIESETGKSIK
ncbi:MAG: tRNA (adenosine(37)-N6)-dimethylallyltransferase MiaA [Bacteroidia bacterium]|nr:tRNA (adenosine(37)-N6)-dimethylallyltransferase MiaA [Bacteroidia bacterium]